MALNTAAKRQAVPGAGRPWMRGQFPATGKGREWRSSVGLSYPVANFQAPVAPAAPAPLPGRRLVLEQPRLPQPLGVVGPSGFWARDTRAMLTRYLGDVAFRLNRALLRDGSVRLTGPLLLNVFTEATKPAASAANVGAIIFVSDGAQGLKFQGSDGNDWIGLDDRLT